MYFLLEHPVNRHFSFVSSSPLASANIIPIETAATYMLFPAIDFTSVYESLLSPLLRFGGKSSAVGKSRSDRKLQVVAVDSEKTAFPWTSK